MKKNLLRILTLSIYGFITFVAIEIGKKYEVPSFLTTLIVIFCVLLFIGIKNKQFK